MKITVCLLIFQCILLFGILPFCRFIKPEQNRTTIGLLLLGGIFTLIVWLGMFAMGSFD